MTDIPKGPRIPNEPQNGDLAARHARHLPSFRDRLLASVENNKDSSLEGRPFLDGNHSLFGYDRVVVQGGVIVALKSSEEGLKPDLCIGFKVSLSGDSRGYIPSGHAVGDEVEITGFAEPFQNGVSDRIICVEGEGQSGWIKPSNVAEVVGQNAD